MKAQASPQRTARPGALRVLLTTEGTYPHYKGGVSTWCDQLLRGMPEVDFTVWSLMMNPFIKQQYEFPDNVERFVGVPLWGIEQPAEYTRQIPSGKVFETARKTRETDVETHFVPIFERFLDAVTAAVFDPDAFAAVLVEMHAYFRVWEYRATWRARPVWEAFKAKLLEPSGVTISRKRAVDEPTLPTWDDVRENLTYLTGGERDDVEDEASSGGPAPREEYVPMVGEAIEGLHWLYRLLQTLNVEVPDVDVTHSAAAAFCAIPCILAKAERGTPFLLTEHGVYIREQYLSIERQRFPYNLKRFLIDFISAVAQTAYKLADQVSPVCAFNARWELNYGVTEDRLRVIYNGVSAERMRPMDVPRSPRPTVVQVGRIDPLKDLETFLRVADRVRREIPDVRFAHWGNISDDDYAERVMELHKELGLQSTVEFNGFTNEPAAAINEGDVVLLTSISEAFPFGVIDAMMCGGVVVSTAVGGVGEALADLGFLAPTKDVERLSELIIQALRMPQDERQQLQEAVRRRALDNFRLEKFIGEYSESYLHLGSMRPVPALVPAEPDQAHLDERTKEDTNVAPFPTAEIPASQPGAWPEPGAEPAAGGAQHAEPEQPGWETPAAPPPAEEPAGQDPAWQPAAAASVPPLDPETADRLARGSVANLIRALADSREAVRLEAARLLGDRGDVTATARLVQVASGDPSTDVRGAALDALAQLVEYERRAGAGA